MTEVTWRTLLDDILRRMRAGQKKDFAHKVGVNIATINRWRRGEDWPQTQSLEQLLAALTDVQRAQMLALMKQDPRVWSLLPLEMRVSTPGEESDSGLGGSFQQGELDQFCLKLLRLQRDSPDRFWQLGGAILRECRTRLETHPHLVGIEIVVAVCMPPREGKVRSLRAVIGMGTSPWRGDLHMKDYFLGIESLAGYVVSTRRGEMIPNLEHTSFRSAEHAQEHAQSVAAFPIMHVSSRPAVEMTLAGALIVSCAQPDYFTPERLNIIETFADIIRLALYDDVYKFYPSSHIELALLPSWPIQRELLATFLDRVAAENKKAMNEEKGEPSFEEIEERVRVQVEGELLQHGSVLHGEEVER